MIMFYLGLSCVVTGSLGTLGAGAWVWASGRDWALAGLISMGWDSIEHFLYLANSLSSSIFSLQFYRALLQIFSHLTL